MTQLKQSASHLAERSRAATATTAQPPHNRFSAAALLNHSTAINIAELLFGYFEVSCIFTTYIFNAQEEI